MSDPVHPRSADARASLANLPTPALVLDRGRLEANARRIDERLRDAGVRLRPHLKSCKSIDVARVALAGREPAATVSTLREAEYFFENGVTDLLYAVGIAPAKLPRVAKLIRRGAAAHVVLDDRGVAAEVGRAGVDLGVEFSAYIELDVDGHRSGVAPSSDELIEIARRLGESPGVRLAGVITHAGDSYREPSLDGIRAAAERERAGAADAARRLHAAGFERLEVSVGSSPTAALAEKYEGITEIRCGVYLFWDLFQSNLGVCRVEDIAVSVLATVIGHQRERQWLITDAGALALSKDRGTADQWIDYGYGQVCDPSGNPIEGMIVINVNQEHGVLASRHGTIDFERFPIGSLVRILPNHACLTAACHEGYHIVVDAEDVVDYCPRINGW